MLTVRNVEKDLNQRDFLDGNFESGCFRESLFCSLSNKADHRKNISRDYRIVFTLLRLQVCWKMAAVEEMGVQGCWRPGTSCQLIHTLEESLF